MIIIPTLQTASARYTVSFPANSVTFYLTFYWSTREAAWYLDISDSGNNPLINGVKIVPDYLLLAQYPNIRNLLGGDFCCIDQSNSPSTSNLNFTTFGVRYFFEYVTLSEIADLVAAQ